MTRPHAALVAAGAAASPRRQSVRAPCPLPPLLVGNNAVPLCSPLLFSLMLQHCLLSPLLTNNIALLLSAPLPASPLPQLLSVINKNTLPFFPSPLLPLSPFHPSVLSCPTVTGSIFSLTYSFSSLFLSPYFFFLPLFPSLSPSSHQRRPRRRPPVGVVPRHHVPLRLAPQRERVTCQRRGGSSRPRRWELWGLTGVPRGLRLNLTHLGA